MNIIFAASDLFVKPAKVMVDSFLRNNPGKHTFYYMYNKTSEKNRRELSAYVKSRGADYNEILMDENKFSDLPQYKRFGNELYFRLLIPFIVPSADRILALDSDIVVNNSLKELYNIDFEDDYLAAAPSPNEKEYKKINNTNQYVGGGVVLYNAKKIREDYQENDLLNFFVDNWEKFPYLDQDLINVFYDGKIKVVSPTYNRIIFRNKKYTNEQLLEIQKESQVIHFPGKIKPWNFYYGNNTAKLYWRHAKYALGRAKYIGFSVLFVAAKPLQPIIRFLRKRKKTNFS
ncbi:MAG: glycosyltransferase family 8 protein [Monoglobaceae bacterium]